MSEPDLHACTRNHLHKHGQTHKERHFGRPVQYLWEINKRLPSFLSWVKYSILQTAYIHIISWMTNVSSFFHPLQNVPLHTVALNIHLTVNITHLHFSNIFYSFCEIYLPLKIRKTILLSLFMLLSSSFASYSISSPLFLSFSGLEVCCCRNLKEKHCVQHKKTQ